MHADEGFPLLRKKNSKPLSAPSVHALVLQMIPPLLALCQNRSKLKLYIAHLTDLCHDRDPSILSQLTPPSHYHCSDREDWEDELQNMTVQQVAKDQIAACLVVLSH